MSNKYEDLHQAIMVDFCSHMLAQTDDIDYIEDYLLHLYTEAGVVVSNTVNGPNNDMLVNGWDGYRTTPKGNKFLGLSTDCDPSLVPVCVAVVLSPTTGHVVPFMPMNGNVFKDIQTSASDGYRWEESSTGNTHDVYKMMADVDDFIEAGAPDPDSHEDYPVHVWQDGVFTTMDPKGSDDSVYGDDDSEDSDEDDTESGEWAESFVKMAEDNIANGMSEEDAYRNAVSTALTSAMTGIPPSMQDILGKLAANGTRIHGVGPEGCVINVGADGSTTTVGGTDITGLFKQKKPDTEVKPLEGFPYMGTPYELSDKFKANIRPRLRDKAKVLGADEDELLEIYASNIPKAVLGIFHQLVQYSHDTEDIISIKKWFDHNGREGLLMSAETDGTTVNSLGSIPFMDYVVNDEVFNGVLEQVEELAARNPDYGYDKTTKDFRHNK